MQYDLKSSIFYLSWTYIQFKIIYRKNIHNCCICRYTYIQGYTQHTYMHIYQFVKKLFFKKKLKCVRISPQRQDTHSFKSVLNRKKQTFLPKRVFKLFFLNSQIPLSQYISFNNYSGPICRQVILTHPSSNSITMSS